MKRICCFLLTLLLCGLLTACVGKTQTVYEVNGFTIDKEAQTITKDGDVYHYEISGDEITITYPNGASYYWTYWEHGGYGGWTDDYDPVRYADGDDLLDIIGHKASRSSSGNGGVGLLIAAIGLFDLLFPRVSWYLGYGWRFKDAEPSDAALVLSRIGGGIALLVGVLLVVS